MDFRSVKVNVIRVNYVKLPNNEHKYFVELKEELIYLSFVIVTQVDLFIYIF